MKEIGRLGVELQFVTDTNLARRHHVTWRQPAPVPLAESDGLEADRP